MRGSTATSFTQLYRCSDQSLNRYSLFVAPYFVERGVHDLRGQENFSVRNRRRRIVNDRVIERRNERQQSRFIWKMEVILRESGNVPRKITSVLPSENQRRNKEPDVALIFLIVQLQYHLMIVVNEDGALWAIHPKLMLCWSDLR